MHIMHDAHDAHNAYAILYAIFNKRNIYIYIYIYIYCLIESIFKHLNKS